MGASVLLTVVVPIMGNILGSIMLCSPIKAVMDVRRAKTAGETNTLPYPMTAINCLGWVCYGIIISNGFLIPANILGMIAGMVFTFMTLPYISIKMADVTTIIAVLFTLHFCVLGTITSLAKLSPSTAQTVWGTNAVVILFIYYAAPLSTMSKVITTRNAASLYPPLAAAAVANGSLWTIYGFVVKDLNVWLPNLFGAVIGVLQLTLRAVYGARPTAPVTGALRSNLGDPELHSKYDPSAGLLMGNGAMSHHNDAHAASGGGAEGGRPAGTSV